MKRTGVIIGVNPNVKIEQGVDFKEELEQRYPGIVFTLWNGITGCAVFEFEQEGEAL